MVEQTEVLNEVQDNGFEKMVKDLAKPGLDIIAEFTEQTAHEVHMMLGVIGEIGELFEAVRANDRENMIEEFGDLRFYITGVLGRRPSPHDGKFIRSVDPVQIFINACVALDKVKKRAIYAERNLPLPVYELESFYWSIAHMMEIYGISVDTVEDHNMNKLLKGETARYKSGSYSNEQALARADKV